MAGARPERPKPAGGAWGQCRAGPSSWCAGSSAWARSITSPICRRSRWRGFRTSASAARRAREPGSLARLVGQRLGWKVYDDELIEAIAHRMVLPIDEVRALDEQAPSMVQDWLLPLREEYYAPQEAYLDHLAKLIEAIGRAGESILVGRGAGFMLPRETTLSVRIIAPLKVRAQRLAERMGVSLRTARRAARDLDRRRAQFDRTMHRANSNDPHNFDIVLDTDSLGLEIAAEIIVHAVAVGAPRGPGSRSRSPGPARVGDDEAGIVLTHGGALDRRERAGCFACTGHAEGRPARLPGRARPCWRGTASTARVDCWVTVRSPDGIDCARRAEEPGKGRTDHDKATGRWKYTRGRVIVGRIGNPSYGEFASAGRLNPSSLTQSRGRSAASAGQLVCQFPWIGRAPES